MSRPIAYDTTVDANEPSVCCHRCAQMTLYTEAPALFAGDEWGASRPPLCTECGQPVRGLDLLT